MSNLNNLSHAELLKFAEQAQEQARLAQAEIERVKREAEFAQAFSCLYVNENKNLCIKGKWGGTIGKSAVMMLSFAANAVLIPEFVKREFSKLAETDAEKKELVDKANTVLGIYRKKFGIAET